MPQVTMRMRMRNSGRRLDDARRRQGFAPMSERQQLAMVMRISSEDAPSAQEDSLQSSQDSQSSVSTLLALASIQGDQTPPAKKTSKKSKQQRNERGETPLHVAAIRGDNSRVQMLLDQGQDPDVPDYAGWTPLHEACSYGWFSIVILLVTRGANVNAKSFDLDTPLHDASATGNLDLVKFLVESGADPFAKNDKGKQPCHYASQQIRDYFMSLRDNNAATSSQVARARVENKKVGNASGSTGNSKRPGNMDGLTQGEVFESKDVSKQEKGSSESKDEMAQLSSGVVSSSQDDSVKRQFLEETLESESMEEDLFKKKKRKDKQMEDDDKEIMVKPAPVARSGPGRVLTGTKPPGPASKTGATPLGKSGGGQGSGKGGSGGSSGKSGQSTSGKGGVGNKMTSAGTYQGKSSGSKGSSSLQSIKVERKSPVPSPKPSSSKDIDGDEEPKSQESAPKVPPLKIVIPGGAGGSAGRTEQEGDGSSGQRGSGKGRGSASTLPYVIPCTSTDAGQTSDSSEGNSDDKRTDAKTGQRVLRSHRTNDNDRDKDKERASPATYSEGRAGSSQDKGHDGAHSPSSISIKSEGAAVEVHPRKRKIKASKESHSREAVKAEPSPDSNITHCNPYQMYIHIRKQIEKRQKGLFPVKPKPPKDFNKYLMNRCTYTLQGNVNPDPVVEIPANLPQQMHEEFLSQEKERTRLRIQHLVEKEKLVLGVEQEILRVHGRAERAVANQALPYSACTFLRDKEVYNVLAPEQEEKRNAQRSRCNGRQINSWLQEVDDKWEKIKEGMLRRQHSEAESLYAVQKMNWEWKLKEIGLCDFKTTPVIEPTHVPQIHVSNFDLPA